MKKEKILHIITGLNNGGAEMMLYKILSNIDRDKYECCVVSLLDKGIIGPKIEALGIPVVALDLRSNFLKPGIYIKAAKLCGRFDIIQTWMYHANLFGLLINLFAGKKLILGIRIDRLIKGIDKPATMLIAKAGGWLSGRADVVVYCSQNAAEKHIVQGYSEKNAKVIPNGFDIENFNKKDTREKILSEAGIPKGNTVIVFVARWNKQKGFSNFLKAVKMLSVKYPDLSVLMAGLGVDWNNAELKKMLEENNIENVSLLGRRDDIADIMSAGDIFVSASYSEGFPNVVGEAMACGLPCVVTDVGDSAAIVGDTGIVAKNNDPETLACGIEKLLKMDKADLKSLGLKARDRIANNYDIRKIVKEYENLYQK